jgi:alanine racemase
MASTLEDLPLAGPRLTVDLAAIRANYRLLRDKAEAAACAAVVKADAYGLGAAQISRALVDEGCDSFFVATLDEAVSLRRALADGPSIMVLNGLPRGSEATALDAEIVPVLNTPRQAEAWMRLALERAARLPCVLHVDTGMARLGMDPDDVRSIAADEAARSLLDVVLVMSHLARSEETQEEGNAVQLARFRDLDATFPEAPRSFVNSSGIFLGGSYLFDLVRPGVALFGVNPTPAQPNPMSPTVRLQAPVLQLRDVPAGATVGYGSTFVAPRAMRLATIGIGYADGWPRRARIGGTFGGRRLPLAGRISMDMLVVDASDADGLCEGDAIDMIGPDQDIDAVAEGFGTIGYEVIAALGPRIERVYTGG